MSVFPDWSGKTEGTPLQLARTSEDASFLKPELNNDSEQWHIITNNSVLWLFILSEVEKSDILQLAGRERGFEILACSRSGKLEFTRNVGAISYSFSIPKAILLTKILLFIKMFQALPDTSFY